MTEKFAVALPTLRSVSHADFRRVLLNEPGGLWRPPALKQLDELVSLPVGWDGYRAPAVTFASAAFALSMLDSICAGLTPLPDIVPGVSGDLQVEWHNDFGDIELHVRRPNDVHAWRRVGGDSPFSEERYIRTDFTEVADWLRELTKRGESLETTAA